ncbi:MAG: DUF1631 family protein [Pseudomonadota bacterium]
MTTTNTAWMEKRAFKRMAVNIRGEITRGGLSRPAMVRDFCMGGMFLSIAEIPEDRQGVEALHPTVGEEVQIRCQVNDEKAAKELLFTAKVVRADKFGLGVHFIGLNFEMLHDLTTYAKRHPVKEAAAEVPSSPATGAPPVEGISQPEAIIARCKDVAATYIEPISKAFLKDAPDKLFATAGSSKDITEQNASFTALGVLNKNRLEFAEVFRGTLTSYWTKGVHYIDDVGENATKATSAQTLSLVQEDTLEDWLSFQDMANKSETLHEEVLNKLDKRLSLVYGVMVDKINNPFAPAAFCHAFQEAIGKMSIERKAVQICSGVFKNILSEHSGKLMEALNQVLIDHHVLPEIVPEYKIRQLGGGAQKKQATDTGEAQKKPVSESSLAGEASPAGAGGAPKTPGAAPDMQGGAPQAVAGDASTQPPAGNAGAAGSGSKRNWFSLVEHLSNLKSQVSNITQTFPGTSSAGDTAGVQPAPQPQQPGAQVQPSPYLQPHAAPVAMQYCSQDELMTALTGVPALDTAAKITSGKRLVEHVFDQLHGQGLGQGGKQIPQRERGLMDVAGNLYDALITDRMVAESVKPWLQKLSIPLVKIALRDESFFTDKNHKARHLVNNIAQLEFYSDEKGNAGISGIQTRINGLLEKIAGEVVITPESLDKALKEVDMLVRVQHKAYSENIKDLITACQNEQAAKGYVKSSDEQALELEAAKDPEFAEWVRRIKRLRAGAYVVIGLTTDTPKRIRLAWVAKNFVRYVFVNKKGLKDGEYGLYELAKHFRDGDAIAPDDMDELVLDRAQYNMLEELNRKLVYETTHDKLTGLINRREFEVVVATAIANVRVDDEGARLCLCFFGIEQLGLVNSNFGYKAGDKLLLDVVNLLKEIEDKEVTLARIGSDEFGILCRCGLDETLSLFDLLRKKFQEYRFEWDGNILKISFHASVAALAIGMTPEKLLQAASSSFRLAKSKGANQLQVYQEDDLELQRQKRFMDWASRIDETLASNRLDIRYQRIVPINPQPGEREHMELLLCLRDEDGSIMSPADFVVAAEYYRRMADIDRWVITKVFTWMSANLKILESIESISINLSGDSLNDERFMGFVLEQTRKTGLPMDRVCFEVTETAGISNLSSATEFIRQVKQTGCKFSLDDFGSGHSSYAYLKNLPVDYLKIDGVFVKEMHKNPSDYAVVKSITEIGHFMGKKIVAEFVENEDVLSLLADIGVDYAQGYVHGAPNFLKDYPAPM